MTNETIMVITGTRKGIGRYLAEYYCQRGYQVVGCSREESNFSHSHYRHFCVDVANEDEVRGMFYDIKRELGHVDIMINNAGIASMNHVLLTPMKTVQDIFDTNFIGTFLFCRESAKLMRRSGGRIVNFATVATPLNLEGEAIYAASKAAIESLTRVLARELAPFRITANAVGPTPVKTDLIRSVPEHKMAALLSRQAIRRYGEFRDISNVVDFFIKPESDFVSGQVIFLGGV
ncbi:MAG TPA: SDR family oxidoreductase [Nitrospira sp.]|nr:SDR family oxidoreductase [Nitrospira sp.]